MKKFSCLRCGKCCKGEIVGNNKEFFVFIFDFEAEKIKQKAEEFGVSLKLKPYIVLNDEISKKGVVVFYEFDHRDCPFYNGKCLVYGERPLMCRAFPVFQTKPFFASKGCPAAKELDFSSPEAVFGNCFSACKGMDEVAFRLKMEVKNLARNGTIKLSKEKKFNKLVGLSDFLKENGRDYIFQQINL